MACRMRGDAWIQDGISVIFFILLSEDIFYQFLAILKYSSLAL
jgi:hypothetical protein